MINKYRLPLVFLISSVLLTLYYLWISTGTMGGGDSYVHFSISKYSWKHFNLFFDHWGKPVFTILSSPFSQNGLFFLKLFNVFCGILSALFVYLSAKKLFPQTGGFSAFGLLLIPYFSALHISGLTEPLFTLFLTSIVYLVLMRRNEIAAIVLVLLPFVRTEGILFLPLLLLLWSVQKQWKPIGIVLLVGIFFNIMGAFFHEGDFLWFITKMPYSVVSNYESGSFFHFLQKSDMIFGLPVLIFSLLGWGIGLFKRAYNTWEKKLVLIIFPVVYFLFHSLLFGLGAGASAGLTRVMIVIAPILALNTEYALNYFSKWLPDKIRLMPFIVFIVWVSIQFATSSRQPVEPTQQQLTLDASLDYLEQNLTYEKVYYYHPYVPVKLNYDPFSGEYCKERLPQENELQIGDLLIWDNHFSPQEGALQLGEIKTDNHWEEMAHFGDEDNFAVYLFQRR